MYKSRLESALAAKVATCANEAQSALKILSGFDFTPAYELDQRLKESPALLEEFVLDPAGVAKREVGLEMPEGAHMHFINEKNEYIPPEGDALSQLEAGRNGKPWTRVEVRSAIGPGCVAYCVYCPPR